MAGTPRKRLLCMTHLPPPVNGVTMMGNYVVNSRKLQEAFELRAIPFKSADSIGDIGTLNAGKVQKALYFAWRLLLECLVFRPHLVYFTLTPNGLAFYRDLIYVFVLRLTGRRRIFHLHGKGVADAARSPLARRAYRWAFGNCSVILLSPLLYDDISGVVERERCFYLPNGIAGPTREVAGVAGEACVKPPHILFLSNLVRTKGPLVLLEALAEMHGRGIDFRASFAGAWESPEFERSFYALVAEKELGSVVRYLGPKYGAEKQSLLLSADIFAFPSYNDAYPLAVLEAMSHALPVIATREGAIPDMVRDGDSGFLVPTRDPGALARSLERLIGDPGLRRSMGEAGKRRYHEEFTLDVFERALLGILRETCDAESTPKTARGDGGLDVPRCANRRI